MKNTTANTTPANDIKLELIKETAPFDFAVKAELDVVDPPELGTAAVGAGVTVGPPRAENNRELWKVTQWLDAGILGVYGMVLIGPRSSGGCVNVMTFPSEVYTPGESWSAPWQDSKVPFFAALGALYAHPMRS